MQDFKISDIQSQQESSLARLVLSHECKGFLKPASPVQNKVEQPNFHLLQFDDKK